MLTVHERKCNIDGAKGQEKCTESSLSQDWAHDMPKHGRKGQLYRIHRIQVHQRLILLKPGVCLHVRRFISLTQPSKPT